MKNKLAKELNDNIKNEMPLFYKLLSDFGKNIFFPKGILYQSAEAKLKAKKYNATIGIAKENNKAMNLTSLSKYLPELDVNEYLPYAPAAGNMNLRKLWAKNMLSKNPALKDKFLSLPVVTNGITHALSLCADLFVSPDDLILCSDMHWENYDLMFNVRYGADIKNFKFYNEDNRFNVQDFSDTLKKLSKKRDKLILILNFPNNPCGYSLTKEEAFAVKDVIENCSKNCKILVICDDAYYGLFYEKDVFTESLFSIINSKNVLPVKLDAATKEDYVWGFRTGFLTFAFNVESNLSDVFLQSVEKKVTGSIRSYLSNCSNISQCLLLKAFSSDTYNEEKNQKYNVMLERYNKVKEVLKKPEYKEYWRPYNFNSGYFMCLKLNDKYNAEVVRQKLLEEEGIGTIAMSDTDLRIAFSSIDVDNIEDLFHRIYTTVKNIS